VSDKVETLGGQDGTRTSTLESTQSLTPLFFLFYCYIPWLSFSTPLPSSEGKFQSHYNPHSFCKQTKV